MIEVEQIKLDVWMPSDAVRIVAMQPYIRWRIPTIEPFRWSNDAVGGQLEAIRRTLEIAASGFGGLSANFTIFPEYSIPGIPGVTVINDRVAAANWPNETIVIAGLDGILKPEYGDLCNMLDRDGQDISDNLQKILSGSPLMVILRSSLWATYPSRHHPGSCR